MKTYQKELSVDGWSLDRRFLVIAPDPKREGMYKSTEVQVADGKESRFSDAYGKCNQAMLLELIKEIEEAA